MLAARGAIAPEEVAADAGPSDGAAAARLLLFGVGGRVYGCDIGCVHEVIGVRRATRLPGAPEYVAGLINLRGTVVTVIDLGLRLGVEPADPAAGSIVLVEGGARVVGLAVDEVRDVQLLGATDLDPVAAGAGHGGFVRGVARVGEGTAIVLDVHAMLSHVLL